jgi:hypothetical protein
MTPDPPAPASPAGGASNSEQTFRREGEYWTIVFDGVTCRLRDARGLQHLAVLLTHPHQEIAAYVLERGLTRENWRGSVDGRERARVNVTRAIIGALQRIGVHHPALASHLRATVRTGTRCSYRPDPRLPLRWATDVPPE